MWSSIARYFGPGITIGAAIGIAVVALLLAISYLDLGRDIRQVRPCTDFGSSHPACQMSSRVVLEACLQDKDCRTNLKRFVRRSNQ